MKFVLKDFLELDTKSLFAVNGGSGCGDSSSPSSGSEKSSGASHSKGSGTYSVSGIGMLNNNSHTSSSSSSSGGSCSGGSGSNVKSSYVREFDNAIVTEYKDKSRKYEYEDGRVVYYPAVDSKGNPGTSTSATAKGGYCSGASDGKTKYPNPYLPKKEPEDDAKDDDNGRGSSTTNIIPPAQETDGGTDVGNEEEKEVDDTSISLNLGWQKTSDTNSINMYMYENTSNDKLMNDTKDSSGNVIFENSFSTDGCKMTGAAKIATDLIGKEVKLLENVNNEFDVNKDGLLTRDEISSGINNLLIKQGCNTKKVVSERIDGTSLSKKTFDSIVNSENTIYVLGCYEYTYVNKNDNSVHNAEHWVVLEGMHSGEYGQYIFSVDGTSKYDNGRTYVYGDIPGIQKDSVRHITKIETFSLVSQ